MLRDTDVAKGPPALGSDPSFDTIGTDELHDATDDPLGSADAETRPRRARERSRPRAAGA